MFFELQSEAEAAEIPEPEEPAPGIGKKIFDAYVKTADIATTLFPLWTVICSAIALKSPSSFAWFTTEYFTAGLAALMLSMGITLTPQDFIDVAKQPGAVGLQFSLCYAMMPVLAFGLAKAFNLDPALLAGMVLVGSINGGQASNLCTYIAKGNVALSVLMTTATTIGAIFMTPIICKALLGAVVPVDAAGIAKSTIQVRCSFSLNLFAVLEEFCAYPYFYLSGRLGANCHWYDYQQVLPQLRQEDSSICSCCRCCFHLSSCRECCRSSCPAHFGRWSFSADSCPPSSLGWWIGGILPSSCHWIFGGGVPYHGY